MPLLPYAVLRCAVDVGAICEQQTDDVKVTTDAALVKWGIACVVLGADGHTARGQTVYHHILNVTIMTNIQLEKCQQADVQYSAGDLCNFSSTTIYNYRLLMRSTRDHDDRAKYLSTDVYE